MPAVKPDTTLRAALDVAREAAESIAETGTVGDHLGMEMVEQYKPEAIVVTMSPFTAAAAGVELKKRTGLPLVFDLRDPWALDETRIYPTRWHGSPSSSTPSGIRQVTRAVRRCLRSC